MINYTKGEWRVENRESSCVEYMGIERLSGDTFPLVISMPSPYSVVGRCGAIVSAGLIPYDEAQANAQLIASAPDLYEALKGILPELKEYVEEVGDCDHSVGICFCGLFNKIDNIEQALAKAGKL